MQVKQFSAEVSVPINCIFPVKNYHSEINPNDDVDSLILSALTYIIIYVEDYINFHMTQSEGLVTYLIITSEEFGGGSDLISTCDKIFFCLSRDDNQ